MAAVRCYQCGKVMKRKTRTYHYVESGLPNVYLEDVDVYYCECGAVEPDVPCIDQVHQRIAELIIKKSQKLTGPEIRFLRKQLLMNAVDFSALLGVGKTTLGKWEQDKVKVDKAYDRMIRALVKGGDLRQALEDLNGKDKKEASRSRRYLINPNAPTSDTAG